jgi:hypothetical protein
LIDPEKDGLIPSYSNFHFAEQARAADVDITVA